MMLHLGNMPQDHITDGAGIFLLLLPKFQRHQTKILMQQYEHLALLALAQQLAGPLLRQRNRGIKELSQLRLHLLAPTI